MLLFLSFPFPIFPFDTDLTFFFFTKKLYHVSNKKLTVTFLQLGVLGSRIVSLFVFFGVPQSHLFPKIILIIYQPYSPLSMANQAFAHFGLEIIRRSSITRPLEGPYSLMILRTLIT